METLTNARHLILIFITYFNYYVLRYSLTLIAICIFYISTSIGQSHWEVFSNISFTTEVLVDDGTAYVRSAGGLLVIDMVTGEEKHLNTTNSEFKGTGSAEFARLENGDIYISNGADGLVRFDGTNYTHHYILDTGDTLRTARDLVSHNNTLWFKSVHANNHFQPYRGLISYSEGEFVNHEDNILGQIFGYDYDSAGDFWVVVEDQVGKYDGTNFLPQYQVPGERLASVRAYFIDSRDRHILFAGYFGTNQNAVVVIDGSDTQVYNLEEWVDKIFEPEPGKIVMSMNEKYAILQDTQFTIGLTAELYPHVPNINNLVEIIQMEGDSAVWLDVHSDVRNSQVYRVTETGFTAYGSDGNFIIKDFFSIASDCEGNLYGTDKASVQLYANDQWNDINLESMMSFCFKPKFVTNPHTCEVWAYDENTGCQSLFKFSGTNFRELAILPESNIRSISFDSNSNIYVANSERITKIDTLGNAQELDGPDAPETIYFTHYADNDVLWSIGFDQVFQRRVIFKYENNVWEKISSPINVIEGLDRYWIKEAEDGSIWFRQGNLKKFVRYLNGEIEVFDMNRQHGILINDLIQDAAGKYWLATSRKGLGHWDIATDQIIYYDVTNSRIHANNCELIQLGSDSTLWITHGYGLSKLSLTEQQTSIEDIDDNSPSHFSLYPNPTHSNFTLSFPFEESRIIEIFNKQGQLVFTRESSNNIVEITNLNDELIPSSYYYVRVKESNKISVKKVFISSSL